MRVIHDKIFLEVTFKIVLQLNNQFFSRPLPKAGRELQTELNRKRIMNNGGKTLSEPEPVNYKNVENHPL